jgi:hypothetical protein
VITVAGLTLPGAIVEHDDDEVTADAGGNWSMSVEVDEGENVLKFEIQDGDDTERELVVTYCLPPNMDRAEGLLVILNQIMDPTPYDEFFCTPQRGNRLIAVNVTVVNTTDDTRDVQASDFEVRDQNGIQWEPALFQCASPTMETLDISAGGQISGWLTFEVRADSRLTEVYYDPDTFTRDDIHIPIP